jgi:IstB-like ATP binding protein
MDRGAILAAMSELKLYGMKAAFDEILATAVKRQHEPQRIIGDLLTAEITEKQVRSVRYQITIAKLPLAKDMEDFRFGNTPINEVLVRDLASGDFLSHQRNLVLVGKRILPSRLLALAFVMAPVADFSMLSTLSIDWRPKPAPDGKAGSLSIFTGKTSLYSMNLATCRSRNPAASCCSI